MKKEERKRKKSNMSKPICFKKKPVFSNDYALYRGDTFIDLGSRAYLAKKLGVKEKTIEFYLSPTFKKRHKDPNTATVVFRIEA